MDLTLKLEVFEGPMDLLLHLIDKNKLNIYDIKIAVITEQYLAYIEAMEVNRMEIMSEFIEMAATLIHIKSEMLLPKLIEKDEEVADPRQALIDKLIEYKKYKLIAEQLRVSQQDAHRVVFKSESIPDEIKNYMPKVDTQELLAHIDFSHLYRVFKSMMKKQVDKVDKVRSHFGDIKRESYTVQEKIADILAMRESFTTFSFAELLLEQVSKVECIVFFLAILELIKMGKICIRQDFIFDDIVITFV